MEALILSCGTGGGHDSAGKAILEELERRGHHAVMFNPYTLKGKYLASGIDKSYVSTVRRAPKAFGAVYNIGNRYRKLPFRSPIYFVNSLMVSAMEKYLKNNPVDIVFMPHLFPAEIFTNMKRRNMDIPKTVFVATDYVCIPFTEETSCDAYIIPAGDLEDDFTGRGIPKDKLYPLGIPTRGMFMNSENKEQARERLGLDIGKRYVLITGGSMGGGKIKKVIEKLLSEISTAEDTEFIIICGSNKELYDGLNKMNYPGVTVVGVTDDMSGYMKASDLFITKPGGLSSTEAAVCGIPILHTSAIPGCETCNACYFSERGMSIACDSVDNAPDIALRLLNDASAREMMINRQRMYINGNAAADICDLAEKMTSGVDSSD